MKEYEKTSSIDKLIEKTLSNLKTIVDSDTVFGNEVKTSDGTVIIPVSKISVGFVVGGGEYADLSTRRVATHYPMAGGSGGGVTLTPIGFIVSTKNEVKFVSTGSMDKCEKMFNNISKIAKFIIKKKKDEENEKNK